MVEFGIIALLFTLIMFAIADFGMLLNGWVAVSAAARDASRRASLGERVDVVTNTARDFAPLPGVRPSQVKVVIDYCSDPLCTTPPPEHSFCRAPPSGSPPCTAPWGAGDFPTTAVPPIPPGYTVRVRVIADTFEVITPLVRPFFGCDSTVPHCYVKLTSGSTMRYEGPPPP
jgi:hypothetical protein